MIKKFIQYYKPHRKLFFMDMIFAFIVSAIDLVFPIVTNRALKVYYNDMKMILIIGAVLLVLFSIKFLLNYFIGYYGHVMGIRLESDMRSDLYKKLQSMDYPYFDDKKTGELMTNLTTHLHDISEMSHHAPEDIFISSLMFIGSFVILMILNWKLTCIAFVCLAVLVWYSLTRRISMRRGFRHARQAQGELNAKVESSLSGIRLTKAFQNEELEVEKFEEYNEKFKSARSETFKAIGLFSSGNDFFLNLTNLALLIFGCYFLSKNDIDLIDLTTYFLYINFLIKPLTRLTNSVEQIEQGFSGIEKFYQIMQENPQIVSHPNAVHKTEFEGQIEFKDVCFQYEQKEGIHILNHFNLCIPKGKKIALVGETGVGKSTISKLVPRFYDVTSGGVYVDDVNVKDYDLKDLRKAIGHVEQDVFIFYGTIRENILYGNPKASEDEMIEAAKKARIHEFIMTQPEKYDTIVGERGIKLSGGQKQRIAIARLFLKNPKILILDEATSSLDNITETYIQESLDELSKNKTTITIAHRLSTVRNADEIIVLGKEGIIERGTHQELLSHNGYYAHMYSATLMV